MKWIDRLFHRHEWVDQCVFDSCIEMTIPTGERRVRGQAVWMGCGCGAMRRRPLTTWAEAEEARARLPYEGLLSQTPLPSPTSPQCPHIG